jgi:replicative DNA helicase
VIEDRSPRQDREAEKAVLGAVLIGGVGALDRCRQQGLRGEHFYEPRHELLWNTAARLAAQGVAVDHMTLMAALGDREQKQVADLLPSLPGAAAYIGNLEWHARSIADAYALRALAEAGHEISRLAQIAPLDKKREALERARGELDKVEVPEERESAATLAALVPEVLDEVESGTRRGLTTGFPELDDMLSGGPAPGQSVVIGARPSVGKTMLGCNLLRTACLSGEQSVMFSLEMTRHELTQRFLSLESGVPLSRIRMGSLRDEDWEQVAKSTAVLQEWPLVIDDEASMTVPDMRSRLRKITRTGHRVRLVCVDYVQLVRPVDMRVPREQQVAGISAGIKRLAKDFACPVVVLAQLSRASQSRRGAKPVLSDLRESGALENDADIVVLMHHPKPDADMELLVAKNRQGERGSVEVVWKPKVMRALPPESSLVDAQLWAQRMGEA